jgi:site-specific recombinase XerD
MCPVWADGTDENGDRVNFSLGTTNWQVGQSIIRDMEVRGSVKDPETNSAHEEIPAAEGITVAEACEKFLGNNTHLSPARLKKYRLQFNRLIDCLERHQIHHVQDVNLELITDFRAEWHATWKLGVGTICLNIQMLRKFFRFCIKREWIQKNPASDLEMPRGKGRPTLPFSQDEWTNILNAFPLYEKRTRSPNGTRLLYAFVLLMRFSGMRIGDTVRSETSWIQGDGISFRTEKNEVNVCNKLPDFVLEALLGAPRKNVRYFFWSGTSSLHSAVGKWQRRLQVLFRLAGVRDGHSHRFRDSYAFDMTHNGRMTLEELRQALGHSSVRTTERYYSHWIMERQERLEAKQDLAWADQRAIQALYKNSDRVN